MEYFCNNFQLRIEIPIAKEQFKICRIIYAPFRAEVIKVDLAKFIAKFMCGIIIIV